MRKSLDEDKKKFIRKLLRNQYENGLSFQARNLRDKKFVSILREHAKYFVSEKEFIDEFTFVLQLELANYQRMLITFYSILFSLLFIFALNIVYKNCGNLFLLNYILSIISLLRRLFFR
jgi:hypothetical protein